MNSRVHHCITASRTLHLWAVTISSSQTCPANGRVGPFVHGNTLLNADRDWVTIETRRGEITLRALVVRTIRPDTVFIPYHWPRRQSANVPTHCTLDPRSKIREFKVSAIRRSSAYSG